MIILQADPGFDTSGYQGAAKRDPKTLVQTDGYPDGYHDLLTELRSPTIAFEKPVCSFACAQIVRVPGNHDARNVRYLHYEDTFGAVST